MERKLGERTALLSKTEQELSALRHDLEIRSAEVTKLTSELVTFEEIRDELKVKSEASRALDDNYKQTLARANEIVGRLETRERELREARYQLERFESGEIHRTLQAKADQLAAKIGELQTVIQTKDKEIEDFKAFLAAREQSLSNDQQEQLKKFTQENEALIQKLRAESQRAGELEGESRSLRRLLVVEEEKSRGLQDKMAEFEKERRALLERLDFLASETKQHQSKISRYLEPAAAARQGEGAPPAQHFTAWPAPEESVDLPYLPFEADSFETPLEDWEIADALAVSEDDPLDLSLAGELPAEELGGEDLGEEF
ncbi:MAG: hypothetical protein HY401_04530 [Elusimicrobia bacterium]|nr:hypothetical protein [Elusimicrobiota bacterium]